MAVLAAPVGALAGSCDSPDGAVPLLPHDFSCESVDGLTTAAEPSRFFAVELEAGRKYEFAVADAVTLCPGNSAGFAAGLRLYDPACALLESVDGPLDGEILRHLAAVSGTHVVEVTGVTAADFGRFGLGARELCYGPEGLSVTPATAVATAGCPGEVEVRFETRGFGPFTWEWYFWPDDPAATVVPTGGTLTTPGPSMTTTATFSHLGSYRVVILLIGPCGATGGEPRFLIEDPFGPTVTTRTDAIECPADLPRSVAPVMPPGGGGPPTLPPPGTGPPCTTGVLENSESPFYDIFVSCDDGSFTARTGVMHPVTISLGDPQAMLAGGADGLPSTSRPLVEDLDTGRLRFPAAFVHRQAFRFDPPDSVAEPASTGLAVEWDGTPSSGSMSVREEIVAFGTDVENAGVRLSLTARRAHGISGASGRHEFGLRWTLDYDMPGDPGPVLATAECDPPRLGPRLDAEHLLAADELGDAFVMRANDAPEVFVTWTSSRALRPHPDTRRPGRIVYAALANVLGSGWDYVPVEGDASADSDSAVLVTYGHAPGEGVRLAEGQSFTRSLVLHSRLVPDACGPVDPGGDSVIDACPWSCVSLTAVAADECAVAAFRLVERSAGAPPCVGDPCLVQFSEEGEFTYTWEAEDGRGNRHRSTTTVRVADGPGCNHPPTFVPGGPHEAECRSLALERMFAEDADGDPITFAWASDNPAVTVVPASGLLPSATGLQPLSGCVAVLAPDVLPCGVTALLTLRLEDARGGRSRFDVPVAFDDTTPPLVDAALDDLHVVWSPNHRMWCFASRQFAPVVADACGDQVNWRFAGCASDQPVDSVGGRGRTLVGDGSTAPDCHVASDGLSFCVRAERAGGGRDSQGGRRYAVQIIATDACGNEGDAVAIGTVHVPHDMGASGP